MKAILSYKEKLNTNVSIIIPGSKSESNRLLVLQKLIKDLTIENLSTSDDTQSIIKGLNNTNGTIDVHHAGTAMRFLTAYFASKQNSEIILTGSKRMQERPIKILVDALISLGADIKYLKNEGYPPIKISGNNITEDTVEISASVSSQYITALMLIAPSLNKGLTIVLEGEVTSIPYIEMTLDLLQKINISCSFSNNKIKIAPLQHFKNTIIEVESDWSSASYFYSLIALSKDLEITLNSFRESSLQGDAEVSKIYQLLGVETIFNSNNSITLKKSKGVHQSINLNLNNTPDIAQTIAVTCFGLGITCNLTGLKTLKIKETDRLVALKTELEKLGAICKITDESLEVFASNHINKDIQIKTYQDHRMAMAFAPLALLTSIEIEQPEVVTKSYPTFWEDLRKLGISDQKK